MSGLNASRIVDSIFEQRNDVLVRFKDGIKYFERLVKSEMINSDWMDFSQASKIDTDTDSNGEIGAAVTDYDFIGPDGVMNLQIGLSTESYMKDAGWEITYDTPRGGSRLRDKMSLPVGLGEVQIAPYRTNPREAAKRIFADLEDRGAMLYI